MKLGDTDTVVYAMWKSYPILTLDLDGGTSSQETSVAYKTGTTLTLTNPTKEEYVFVGWEVISGDGVLS